MTGVRSRSEVRKANAQARLLAKLPCPTSALTFPEKEWLIPFEEEGRITYDATAGVWRAVADKEVGG